MASASSILEKAASVPKQGRGDGKNKNGRGTTERKKQHETGGEDDVATEDDGDKGRSRLDPSSTTIVALGAAAGTIALLFILLTVRKGCKTPSTNMGSNKSCKGPVTVDVS